MFPERRTKKQFISPLTFPKNKNRYSRRSLFPATVTTFPNRQVSLRLRFSKYFSFFLWNSNLYQKDQTRSVRQAFPDTFRKRQKIESHHRETRTENREPKTCNVFAGAFERPVFCNTEIQNKRCLFCPKNIQTNRSPPFFTQPMLNVVSSEKNFSYFFPFDGRTINSRNVILLQQGISFSFE